MTKLEMVQIIAWKTGVDQVTVTQIVQMTLDGITDAVASEGRLELRNFGVFEVRSRKARKARNPRTGAEVLVPSRLTVYFKAGKIMNEKTSGDGNVAPQPSAPNLK